MALPGGARPRTILAQDLASGGDHGFDRGVADRGHGVSGVLPRHRPVRLAGGRLAHLPPRLRRRQDGAVAADDIVARSEEHTSELQSPFNLLSRLPLQKKNTYT